MHPRAFVATLILIAVATLMACGTERSAAEHLERARAFESEGKLRAAVIETRNALKRSEGNDAEARLLLGLLQLRVGVPADAEKELLKARELGADETRIRPALARALLLQGKFEALAALDEEGLPPPTAADLLASRALGRLADGELANARRDLRLALELDPEAPEARIAAARLDAVDGDLDGAGARLEALLEGAPDNAEAWELAGDIARAAGRREDALGAYDRAIEHADNPLMARLKRIEVNLEHGENAAARADLDALSKDGLELAEIDAARGQIALREGDLEDAQVRFERALNLAPEHPPALGGLALTHLLLGNVEQAEQYGKQMMAATEGADDARRLLGAIRLESGRFGLAESTVEPIVRIGERPDLFSNRVLSTALLKQDKYDEAIEQMIAVGQRLPPEAARRLGSPFVLSRPPSSELFDELTGGADAMEREIDESFLDEDERRIARVLELLGRGEHDEALAEAEALRASLPRSAVPHALVGRVHLAAGRDAAARAAFERVLGIDPGNITAQRFLAELDLGAGDVDAARARLEGALDADDPAEEILLSLARLEAQEGDEGAMLEWLERARTEHPESGTATMLLARYRASRAEHERVLEELSRLDRAQRRLPAVLRLESTALIGLRRFEEALERLDALVGRQPDSPDWRYLRAQARAGTGDAEGAVSDLERALAVAPDHAASHLAMANIAIRRGDAAAAEERIERLRELIPGTAELDAVVARLNEQEERPAEGVPSRLHIESTAAALAAARDLWDKGEPEKAVGLLETWLDANPTDHSARLVLADAYAALRRTDEAVAAYERLIADDGEAQPDRIRLATLNNLAWHLREEDTEQAIDYAERALEIDPESVETLDTLAMVHFGRGDLEAAKAAFDRLSALGTDNPTILYHGARIEAALGDEAAARELLEPLVEGSREFPESEEAAGLLEELGGTDG